MQFFIFSSLLQLVKRVLKESGKILLFAYIYFYDNNDDEKGNKKKCKKKIRHEVQHEKEKGKRKMMRVKMLQSIKFQRCQKKMETCSLFFIFSCVNLALST